MKTRNRFLNRLYSGCMRFSSLAVFSVLLLMSNTGAPWITQPISDPIPTHCDVSFINYQWISGLPVASQRLAEMDYRMETAEHQGCVPVQNGGQVTVPVTGAQTVVSGASIEITNQPNSADCATTGVEDEMVYPQHTLATLIRLACTR